MKKLLTRKPLEPYVIVNGDKVIINDSNKLDYSISGNVSSISGDVSFISGDVSFISGDVSFISGNVDDCEITDKDRKNLIYVNHLISE